MGEGEEARQPRRRYRARAVRSSDSGMTTRRVPVKGVGRHADRFYCPRCGQRRKLCTCVQLRP